LSLSKEGYQSLVYYAKEIGIKLILNPTYNRQYSFNLLSLLN